MNKILSIVFFALSVNSFAVDMAKTESYKTAYKELKDGSSIYVGKCSTHQGYEKKYYKITKTLVEYFEPGYDSRESDTQKHILHLESELIEATKTHLQFDSIADVDDLTVEKIESTKFKGLDLFRLNIGVGGGNGMYVVFNRTIKNRKVNYELMSSIMDGDVEFCDSKVWL
jgi:hypothetical protein